MTPDSPMSPAAPGQRMPETALVLAGGLGTRLRPVVADRPKVLAPAAGKPFIHFVLTYLAGQGIRRVVLCVGYLAQAVQEYVGDGGAWGLQASYSLEQSALGTAGALRQAGAGLSEVFFALNGDTLFRADLAELWAQQRRVGGLASMALLCVDQSKAAGVRGCVRLAEDGHIRSFDEKPALVPGGPVLINGGVYLLEPRALADVPPNQAVSIEREVFPRLAAQGLLAGCVQDAYFADIGTPDSLAAFEEDVMRGIIT